MPSLTNDFFHALTTNSSNLLGGTQGSQTSHGGLDNVLGIVGAQALSADVLDANSFHNSTDSAAGDNTGAFGSGLQQNSAGTEDADYIMNHSSGSGMGDTGFMADSPPRVTVRVARGAAVVSGGFLSTKAEP